MDTIRNIALLALVPLVLFACQKKHDEDAPVHVTSVELDITDKAITEEETFTLTATVLPENASDRTVTWSSSNGSVAAVNEGVVTGVSAGTAFVYATAGGMSASCRVTVNAKIVPPEPVHVTSVTLNKTTLDLLKGKSDIIFATVLPDNATDKTVSWSSSDSSIAAVENGTVKALKSGTAVITATADGVSATCTVNVSESHSSNGGDPEGFENETW